MFFNRFNLHGKTALVNAPQNDYATEVAIGLVQAGAQVWLCGDITSIKKSAEQAKEAGAPISGLISYIQGTEESAKELAQTVKSTIGKIDIFVDASANVSCRGWSKSFDEISLLFKQLQTGLIMTVKHIGLYMAEAQSGSVLFLTNYGALVGYDVHNYTKQDEFEQDFSLVNGFLCGSYVNYTRQAAGYLGENNIRCNCLAYAPLTGKKSKDFEEKFIRHSHLKRMASVEDVQSAAVFFASDASSYITGVTLPIDGGYTAK